MRQPSQAMTQVAKRDQITTYVLPQPNKHTTSILPNNNKKKK